jgi:hypothetical protein
MSTKKPGTSENAVSVPTEIEQSSTRSSRAIGIRTKEVLPSIIEEDKLGRIHKLCNAHNRSGKPCRAYAAFGSDKCYFHCGFKKDSLCLTSSPDLVPVVRNKYFESLTDKNLKDKLAKLEGQDIFDLTDEINLSKALLQQSLNNDAPDVKEMSKQIGRLGQLVATFTEIRNSTALTVAETSLIYMKMAQLVKRYVAPEMQQAYIREIRGLVSPNSVKDLDETYEDAEWSEFEDITDET